MNGQTFLVSLLLSFTTKSGAKAFQYLLEEKAQCESVIVNKQTILVSFVLRQISVGQSLSVTIFVFQKDLKWAY